MCYRTTQLETKKWSIENFAILYGLDERHSSQLLYRSLFDQNWDHFFPSSELTQLMYKYTVFPNQICVHQNYTFKYKYCSLCLHTIFSSRTFSNINLIIFSPIFKISLIIILSSSSATVTSSIPWKFKFCIFCRHVCSQGPSGMTNLFLPCVRNLWQMPLNT